MSTGNAETPDFVLEFGLKREAFQPSVQQFFYEFRCCFSRVPRARWEVRYLVAPTPTADPADISRFLYLLLAPSRVGLARCVSHTLKECVGYHILIPNLVCGILYHTLFHSARTLVSAMVEGTRCWADEAEKPRFGSAAVQITYMLAWHVKFLAILHI